MKLGALFLLGCLSVFSLNAAEVVDWDLSAPSSAALSKILAQAKNFPEVSVTGYVSGREIRTAQCRAHVLRPQRSESSAMIDERSKENKIQCQFDQETGPGKVILSLAKVPVSSWGGKYDKPTHFSIEGTVATKLYSELQSAWEQNPDEPLADQTDYMGPAQHRIQSYGILSRENRRKPDGSLIYSQIAVDCVHLSQEGKTHSIFCNFLDF
ncbi:MAG: hypothetical protein HY537_15480 [Deltaproteobacteria bacterium]|nr:hypothetical protein [Deltaproteobacteria bacterium]